MIPRAVRGLMLCLPVISVLSGLCLLPGYRASPQREQGEWRRQSGGGAGGGPSAVQHTRHMRPSRVTGRQIKQNHPSAGQNVGPRGGAGPTQRLDTNLCLDGYAAVVHRNTANRAGDVLEILKVPPGSGRGLPRASWHRVFVKDFSVTYDLWIESISSWRAPDPSLPPTEGLLVGLQSGGAGSSKRYYIIARTPDGRFKEMFHALCIKGGPERPPETVDLDGDSLPELVVVPEYKYVYGPGGGLDLAHTRAQVWKWNTHRFGYVMVRESSYSRRLEPLSRGGRK